MSSKDELGFALVDVRKAYRLLYQYQAAVFDLALQFSEKLGCKFCRWEPYWAASKKTKALIDCSPWELLPSYDFSVLYLSKSAHQNWPKKGHWLMELRFKSDSGYKEDGYAEPKPAQFITPEESQSMLEVYGFVCQRNFQVGKKWYKNIYQATVWPANRECSVQLDSRVKVVGLHFDLATMAEEQNVEAGVAEFRKLLLSAGALMNS